MNKSKAATIGLCAIFALAVAESTMRIKNYDERLEPLLDTLEQAYPETQDIRPAGLGFAKSLPFHTTVYQDYSYAETDSVCKYEAEAYWAFGQTFGIQHTKTCSEPSP